MKIYKRSREKIKLLNYKNNFSLNRYLIGIENVILNPKTGVARVKKRIIEESTIWHASNLRIWEPKPIFTKKINARCINLADNGFFHYLTEDLPRFLEILAIEPQAKIVYGSLSEYVSDTLGILKISSAEYFNCPITCQELIFSEKTLGGIFSSHDRLKLIKFSENIKTDFQYKNIFISRKDTAKGRPGRGLNHLTEIELLFSRNNFKILYLEDLPLTKQISLIKGAKVIAGMHGAGLTNLLWNTSKCTVMEISESRRTNHFAYLSKIANHRYLFKKSSELLNFSDREFLKLIYKRNL